MPPSLEVEFDCLTGVGQWPNQRRLEAFRPMIGQAERHGEAVWAAITEECIWVQPPAIEQGIALELLARQANTRVRHIRRQVEVVLVPHRVDFGREVLWPPAGNLEYLMWV